MAKTIIVVNRHRVRANQREFVREEASRSAQHTDTSDVVDALPPIFSVRRGRYGKPYYPPVRRLELQGDVVLVYSPDDPLPCGATVWLETDDDTVGRYFAT